jgi:hypothetical protein
MHVHEIIDRTSVTGFLSELPMRPAFETITDRCQEVFPVRRAAVAQKLS